MSVKISNFKTGYTGRLVKKLAELKELLTEHLEDDDPILYIEEVSSLSLKSKRRKLISK